MVYLEKSIIETEAGFCIIDHLGAGLGEVGENESGMATVMGNLRALVDGLEIGLGIVHHSTKSRQKIGAIGPDDARGHSSIAANNDTIINVERQEFNSQTINLIPVATRGKPFDAFSATFSFESDSESNELHKCIFFGVQHSTISEQIENEVLNILSETEGLNQSAMRNIIAERMPSAGDPKIRSTLYRMVRSGKVITERGRQNSLIYKLIGGDKE